MPRRRKPKTDRSVCLWRSVALIERLEPRLVLSAPPLPTITGPTLTITSFGAVGDGTTNNTTAIQNCINSASLVATNEASSHSALVGAVVEIPAAASPFECGPITIPSNIDLQVDSGAELQALAMASYPNATSNPASFVTFNKGTNQELSGSGTIDGQGAAWWAAFNAGTISNRPRLINVSGASTMLIQGVTLTNSPMFHIAFGSSTNVTINDVTISSPSTSPNTDGIDPAGTNFLIENCSISTGDDNIAIKPQSTPCGNITVSFCTFGTGHGLSVGGETNDGLNGLEVNNCTFNGTTSGIRLKAGRTTGGLVQNCTYTNLTMTNVEYPININSYYPNTVPPSSDYTDPAQAVTAGTPIWENISFSNITSTNSASNSQIGVIWGLPEEPVNTVTFNNVQISAHLGMDIDHAHNISFASNCKLTAASGPDIIGDSAVAAPMDETITLAGWNDQDVGAPSTPGTSIFDPDTGNWTIAGGGTGIGGTLDRFNLASAPLAGNGAIAAKLTSLSTSNAAAQAGVTIRESSASNAAFASALVTPSSGVEFEWRPSDGAATQSVFVTGKAAPLFVMVQRQGNSFSAYDSSTGAAGSWVQIGSTQTITMNTSAVEGLAVSANNTTGGSTAAFSSVNTGPVIVTAATANPTSVTAETTALSVQGTSALSSTLTYDWSDTGPGSVVFSNNDTSASLNTTATFSQSGTYSFTVTITDSEGLATTSTVGVNVLQTLSSLSLTPLSPNINENQVQQFTAVADDQFGMPLATQPGITYNLGPDSVGGINASSGLFTAGSTPGVASVFATSGAIESNDATLTVINATPTVAEAAAANPNTVTGTTTNLSVLGADDGGESNLTYSWAATGPAAVMYSDNGDNSAKNTAATFSEAGQYNFTVTITDAGGLSTTSSTMVTVVQTPTVIDVSPPNLSLSTNRSQQFAATAADQFGNSIASPSFEWSIDGPGNSIDQTGFATLGATPGMYTVTAALGAVQGTASVTTASLAAPTVTAFIVNDGNAQRSMVTSLTVTFSEPVTLASGAISLGVRPTGGGVDSPVDFNLTNPSGDQQTYVLTFTEASDEGGSLPDGVYDLKVSAALVTNADSQNLSPGDQTFAFYRLYGDYVGQGSVGFGDLVLLAEDFGITSSSPNYLSYMDVTSSGSIGFAALANLAENFGKSLSINDDAVAAPQAAPAPVTTFAATPTAMPAAAPVQAVANNPTYTPGSIRQDGDSGDPLASPPVPLLS